MFKFVIDYDGLTHIQSIMMD